MKTEKILTSVFILALLAHFFNLPGHSLLLILSSVVISFMYFPLAFYFYTDKTSKQQNMVLSVLGGMVLSIIPLGIVFKTMAWPGYEVQLGAALILTPILLIVTFLLSKRNDETLKTYYKNFLTRIVFWLLMCVLFNFISVVTLIKIQYRNDPELVKLKIQSLNNPDNSEYQDAIENYHRQQDSITFAKEINE